MGQKQELLLHGRHVAGLQSGLLFDGTFCIDMETKALTSLDIETRTLTSLDMKTTALTSLEGMQQEENYEDSCSLVRINVAC